MKKKPLKTILSENVTLVEDEPDPEPISPIAVLASLAKDYEKDPGKNRPCKTCKKPTRSHWDPHEKTMQCHVCWLAEQEKKKAEED